VVETTVWRRTRKKRRKQNNRWKRNEKIVCFRSSASTRKNVSSFLVCAHRKWEKKTFNLFL